MIAKIKSLTNHQGFRKYFANTSWLFAEKILRMGVGLFVGIWVARYLGPERFGLLSYAQSFVGLFSAIATLGLDGIVVRELVKKTYKEEEIVGTAFLLKLIGAFLVLVILAIAVRFTSNDIYVNMLVFIIASSAIFQSFNVIDMYFQSKVLSKYIVFANMISLFISSLVKILLILNSAPLEAFAAVVVFDSFILALGYLYFFLKHSKFRIKNLGFKKEIAINLLRDSWPLILSGMVIAIYMKIDQVMIKEMLGNEEVGQYAAAVRISEAWYFIPMVISSSLFPAIVNAKKVSEKLYYERLQKFYDLMVCLAIAIALTMTFLSDWVIHLLYGEAYSEAGKVLMIHIWAGVFVFLMMVSGNWFIIENLTKLAFFRNLFGAISNILLNLFFIRYYGIIGAAISTLVSYMIAAYWFDLMVFKNKKLKLSFYLKTHALFCLIINLKKRI